jgi:hypothetical protein
MWIGDKFREGNVNKRMMQYLLSLAVLVLVFSCTVNAQVNTGSIAGTVHDSSGAAIVGATVTATSVATSEQHSAVSGSIGEFTLQGLPPGNYKVRVTNASFKTMETNVEVTVGASVTLNPQLEVGSSTTVVEVSAGAGTEVNTQTQELSQLVDTQQLAQLPSLNRNPYDFVILSGNVSNGDNTNASMNSSQNLSSRGVGYAINGQREASTEILLDGVENIGVFTVVAGQTIPVDSIQEFSIITNNFGPEFGRASGGIVNVDTKAGTNDYHGSLFEYNRVSALTANTFANDSANAASIADGGSIVAPKGIYTRNQFGFNVGGPIFKNKLFAYFSEEFVRVRSAASVTEDVFDPAFLALLPANDQAYFAKYGTGVLPSSSTTTVGAFQAAGGFGQTCNTATPPVCTNNAIPLLNGLTTSAGIVPATTAMFDTVHFNAPFNSGGGVPQNANDLLGRLDYNMNAKTQMFFRFARYNESDFPGSDGYSPYPQYDVGGANVDDSALLSVNYSFRDNLLNNLKLSYTRFNVTSAFNTALTNTPNLFLQNGEQPQSANPVSGNIIQLPGLQNSTDGSGGLPFGGPQNTVQIEEDLAWTKGRHTMRFGGEFTYIQLNYAYGAYQQAVEAFGGDLADSMNSMLNAGGVVDPSTGAFASPMVEFDARVNGGVLPCVADTYGNLIQTPACTVTPPLAQANPARSYRYKDWAMYAQDSFKITRRLTLNYGLRYEHYGVQHNNKQNLDSNFVFANCAFPCNIETGQVEVSPTSPIGQMWAPRWGTPAPRVGFAYDVFGNGKTALRGGFGISYERNFGNVTYNASFNPPASAVVTAECGAVNGVIPGGAQQTCNSFITNNDLGPLGLSTTGPSPLPPTELRDNATNINVAQTQFWSLGLEHQLTANTMLALSYSGAHSVHLYDLANMNLPGSAQAWGGEPQVTGSSPDGTETCPYQNLVTGVPTCYTRLNQQYSNINVRGSNGVGAYDGLNVKFQSANLHHTGLTLIVNYTWSHSFDDLSDTFSGSLTSDSLGYLDPLHPQLDYGSSDFDERHRVVISPVWQTPWFKSGKGFLTQALGGWNVSGIYTAHTGIPFSIYNISPYILNYYLIPRLIPASPITQYSVSGSPAQVPGSVNQFVGLNVPANGQTGPLNPTLGIDDFGPFPANMTSRNAFRGPGAWNLDAAVQKDFKLTERFGLQFRAEGFDILNHHNYYLAPFSVTNAPQIILEKGGIGSEATGGDNDERRFMQFSLRLTF